MPAYANFDPGKVVSATIDAMVQAIVDQIAEPEDRLAAEADFY